MAGRKIACPHCGCLFLWKPETPGPLTAEELRKILRYDPETGEFHWLNKGPGRSRKVGGLGNHGYIRINVKYTEHLAHRLAWLWVTGLWPNEFIDHINGIKTDNHWANLRRATNSQNLGNKGLMRTNTTGLTGVYRGKNKRWLANFRNRHLGMFDTAKEAYEAYKRAAIEAHGEFAHSSLTGELRHKEK